MRSTGKLLEISPKGLISMENPSNSLFTVGLLLFFLGGMME